MSAVLRSGQLNKAKKNTAKGKMALSVINATTALP